MVLPSCSIGVFNLICVMDVLGVKSCRLPRLLMKVANGGAVRQHAALSERGLVRCDAGTSPEMSRAPTWRP